MGDSFGGVSVEVAAVTVEGDAAEVSYDLLFGGNPTYPDLSGTAVLTDDGWKVPRRWVVDGAVVTDVRGKVSRAKWRDAYLAGSVGR